MTKTIRRSVGLLGAAIAIVLAATSPRAQQPPQVSETSPPVPKAVLPFTSYAFDDVYRGEIISHIFAIKNVGNADLVIKDFVAGCACEVLQSDRVIPPGKEGRAVIEINTTNVIGGAVRTATLHTNDPERSTIVLTLIANVLSNPDGSPLAGAVLREGKHVGPLFVGPGLRWGAQVPQGGKAGTEFTISVDRGPVKIVRVEGDQTRFVPRLTTVEEGKKYKLSVGSAPTGEVGRYETTLRIITDSAVLPYFEITLFLKVLPKS